MRRFLILALCALPLIAHARVESCDIGQPREKLVYERNGERLLRHDTGFHDNGQVSSEGSWVIAGRYDERGRITRERELDANGTVERDDAVFEDGSRKAFSR